MASSKPSQKHLADLPEETIQLSRKTHLKQVAKKLGFRKTNYVSKSGQAVYTDGSRYISIDIDSHNGGAFKMAGNVDDLNSKTTRWGTYDESLKRLGD